MLINDVRNPQSGPGSLCGVKRCDIIGLFSGSRQ